MDTKYPTLKRPPKKLCYFSNKGRPATQWTGKVSLLDIDKLFDDLDSGSTGSRDDDPPPLSPVLGTHSRPEKRQAKRATPPTLQEVRLTGKHPSSKKVPKNEAMHPVVRSESPIQDIVDMDSSFKDEAPLHTSSPIERTVDAEERDCGEEGRMASPLLIACDEDVREEIKREPPPTQTPLCSGQITQGGEEAELLESPPNIFVLGHSKTSRSRTVAPSSRQGNAGSPASAVTLEHQYPAQEKSEGERKGPPVEKGTRVSVFLQKLKEAELSKPACPRKTPSPLKVPTPEPVDDFQIMEVDAPTWVSISRKSDPNSKSRQKQSRTSSSGEEGPTDKAAKDNRPGKAETHPASLEGKIRSAEEPQAGQPKTKGKTGKAVQKVVSHVPISTTTSKMTPGLKTEGSGPDPDVEVDVISSQEDLLADDGVKQGKLNIKKQNMCTVASEEGIAVNKAEAQPRKSATAKSGEAEPSVKKTEKKAVKSPKARRSKASKGGKGEPRQGSVQSVKESRGRIRGSGASEEPKPADAVKEWSQEPSGEEHGDAALDDLSPPEQDAIPAQEITKPKQRRKATSKVPASSKAKQSKPSSGSERDSAKEEQHVAGKRRRNKPGQWWTLSTEETKEADGEQNRKEKNPKATAHSPIKTGRVGDVEDRDQRQSGSSSSQTAEQKDGKRTRVIQKRRERTLDRMHKRTIKGKTPGAPAPTSPKRPPDYIQTPIPEKRRRNNPGDGGTSSTQHNPKTKLQKSRSLGGPQNGAVSSKPGVAETPQPLLKQKFPSAPKTVRSSLTTFTDIYNSAAETPAVANVGNRHQKKGCKMLFPVQGEEDCTPSIKASDFITGDPSQEPATDCIKFTETKSPLVFMEPAGECKNKMILPSCCLNDLQESKRLSDNTLKGFRSGPASMIEPEHYEENEDLCLPSNKVVRPVLSETELCSPPLVPMELEAQDKANVAKWLKGIWPVIISNGARVNTDQFEWYTYRGRVMGVLVDLQYDSFCNGKLLLGSFTKKPLWVDHSATSVFNILTSGVSVTINGKESFYNPGQTFLAPCGYAYSIQNLTREPAVLCFNRMLAESPD